jgi:RNA polymerase sigma-70 factor (family 1)
METCYITYSDEKILLLITDEDDRQAFTELYDRYFKILFNYTFSKVNDEYIAQEIVQELFVSIWQKRSTNVILVCRPYLFSMAKRLIITHYRKQNTREQHYSEWTYRAVLLADNTDHHLLSSDLENSYQDSLQLLPPKCKQVFLMSRQGHPNREIAEKLSISEKTVEQHISKALRILKESMSEFFTYSILFFILFFISE